MIGIGKNLFKANVKAGAAAPAYDADALAFFTAASITDTTQKNAVNQLVLDLKSASIWTKMKALYPVVGGVASSHAVNLKTPGTYNLTFQTGWTHASTGMTPNGATYANTGLAPGTIGMSSSSLHLSYYSRTTSVNGTSRVCIGSTSGIDDNSNITILTFGNSGTAEVGSIAGRLDATEYSPTTTLSNYVGLKFVTVNGNRNARYYKNGVFIPNQVAQTRNLDQYPLYLSAINRYNTIADTFNNQQCAFASIGDGLTDAEASSFYTAVQTYQTTLGRQV